LKARRPSWRLTQDGINVLGSLCRSIYLCGTAKRVRSSSPSSVIIRESCTQEAFRSLYNEEFRKKHTLFVFGAETLNDARSWEFFARDEGRGSHASRLDNSPSLLFFFSANINVLTKLPTLHTAAAETRHPTKMRS